MRALVLGDDPLLDSALEKALADVSECEKVADAASALAIIDASLADGRAFDLVIIDIARPELQDGSIITDIRNAEDTHHVSPEKRTCLIVTTASSGRQRLTDFMFKGCDAIVDKPIVPDQLVETLSHFNLTDPPRRPEPSLLNRITGKELSERVIKRIDRNDVDLPPAPKIAIRLRQLIDLKADIEEAGELLKHDLSISTKLIRMSNSVAYGGFEKSTTASQAIRRIGTDRSVELILSICCRSYFVTNHPAYKRLVEDLWWHSLACAHATEMVVHHRQVNVDDDLFALGLLHDVGKVILLQAASNLQLSERSALDIDPEALASMLSEHHELVGMRILRKWGYTKAFASLIQLHRTDGEDPPVARQVLQEANLLATAAGFGYGALTITEATDQLEQSGYSSPLREDLITQIRAKIKQLRFAFA